jgi:spermidine dehydrogenase
MAASITRRDFLGSALLASGSALLAGLTPRELLVQDDDFTGYGGVGEYSTANGNTWDVLEAGMRSVTVCMIRFLRALLMPGKPMTA